MTKTALVTGGNRGIGLETVRALAALGHHVLLGCRNMDEGKALAESINGNVTAVHVDLSNSESLRTQARAIMADHDIDILVNNGAILKEGTTLSVSPQDFNDSIQVNLIAAFDLIQEIVPGMCDRRYGRIVNVTSDWGSFADGLTGPAAYSVSKAALNALTMNMGYDMPPNVKVNSVHPGWVRTDMGGTSAPLSKVEGAETIVWLATLEADGPNGGFFTEMRSKAW